MTPNAISPPKSSPESPSEEVRASIADPTLVLEAGGSLASLPLEAVRRIEPVRLRAMPCDPGLGAIEGTIGGAVASCLAGMAQFQGEAYGVLTISGVLRLDGVQGVAERPHGREARLLFLAPEWLMRVGGASRLVRPGLALLVDRVIDVRAADETEARCVPDVARILSDLAERTT